MPDTVGARVRALRKQRGWLQRELAKRARVAPPTISALECGRLDGARIAVDIAGRLAKTLGVTLDALIGEPASPKKIKKRRFPKPSDEEEYTEQSA